MSGFGLATQIASQPIDSVTTISQIILYGESSFTTCSGGVWITPYFSYVSTTLPL
jgi:hypothetical protein